MSNDYYGRLDKLSKILNFVLRCGKVIKYDDLILEVQTQTGFTAIKLEKELDILHKQNKIFFDKKENTITPSASHYPEQVTPSSDDDGIDIPNKEEGG